jgi:hypothetical protein
LAFSIGYLCMQCHSKLNKLVDNGYIVFFYDQSSTQYVSAVNQKKCPSFYRICHSSSGQHLGNIRARRGNWSWHEICAACAVSHR